MVTGMKASSASGRTARTRRGSPTAPRAQLADQLIHLVLQLFKRAIVADDVVGTALLLRLIELPLLTAGKPGAAPAAHRAEAH